MTRKEFIEYLNSNQKHSRVSKIRINNKLPDEYNYYDPRLQILSMTRKNYYEWIKTDMPKIKKWRFQKELKKILS